MLRFYFPASNCLSTSPETAGELAWKIVHGVVSEVRVVGSHLAYPLIFVRISAVNVGPTVFAWCCPCGQLVEEVWMTRADRIVVGQASICAGIVTMFADDPPAKHHMH